MRFEELSKLGYPILSARPLVVNNCTLSVRGKILVVANEKFTIPVEFRSFDELWIMPDTFVSGSTLYVLAKYGKSLFVLGKSGVSSVLLPLATRWFIRGDATISQVRLFTTGRTIVARRIVEGIIRNIRFLLDYLGSKKILEKGSVEFAKKYVNRALERLNSANTINDIVSCEAEAWNFLYLALSEKFEFFSGRIKRPPRDPLNALISYFNSILYGLFIRYILKSGLEPTVSFVHSPYGYKRFALAFDLKDIFAPATSIRSAIVITHSLYRKGLLEEAFECSEKGCYLKEPYRSRVVQKFFNALRRRTSGYSYFMWMYKECVKLREFILGHRDSFEPWLWRKRRNEKEILL